MKSIVLVLILLIGYQPINAQQDETNSINALKKVKCLAKMTNCVSRKAFYEAHVNYWQCYLDNNLNNSVCNYLFPTSKMPDCGEDDLNFPPSQYTTAYLDKCIASISVVITKKTPAVIPQMVENTAQVSDLSGTYFIANESAINGNIVQRIEIEEEKINSKESQISIMSNGLEVMSVRRKALSETIAGNWLYISDEQDDKLDRLKIKRPCNLKISEDGFILIMQNVKFRPQGGLFANVVNIWDLSNKGYDTNSLVNNVLYELALEKGTTNYEFVKKK